MNMLSTSPAHPGLVEAGPGVAPATVSGIRDLLRDTALFVANLSTGGTVENFNALRTRCASMVADLSAALERRAYPEDVRDDAVKAQCALLDETALQHLSHEDKPLWSAQPLQVEKFKQHAGLHRRLSATDEPGAPRRERNARMAQRFRRRADH
jgi:type VI secretion system protein ImpK